MNKLILVMAVAAPLAVTGCTTAEQTGVGGAAVGAAVGGLATGTTGGALGGALIGGTAGYPTDWQQFTAPITNSVGCVISGISCATGSR